ncbi:MAG: hypothetical protein A3K19_21045 [Lentisphaerae bacterium RIFOXYB12_FULL_65_16]|nr:MAG: hypothetical protein A3K18_16540 [Lentisphaerae bacterium RIFOXYA12_64_32]OGV84819.1 MAG: hypothetical protein A3K19_21045 [Lentisphaerae bacterium RIFOXYB12_FULL_65_16]
MVHRRKAACELKERKTKFVDIFRTTPVLTVCPNFYVLMHANGCTFAPLCRYCYLKSSFWYLQKPRAFSNVEPLLREVSEWIAKDDLESYILNAGNLSDSLTFEGPRPLAASLVEVFRREAESKDRRHVLLLVTKGGARECEALLSTQPCRNVVISFSVNSPDAARRYEEGAAPVEERLDTARRLRRQGWRVRMRIDPMIQGEDYTWLIEELRKLAPERLTLGSLRAEDNLLRSSDDELFSALEDPKDKTKYARYPRDVRLALYRQAVEAFSGVCPIGLCEETRDVWDALGLDADARSCNCGS